LSSADPGRRELIVGTAGDGKYPDVAIQDSGKGPRMSAPEPKRVIDAGRAPAQPPSA
jgi:hypothetical protein